MLFLSDIPPGDALRVLSYLFRRTCRHDASAGIAAARFKAYGCGWLIACGSLLTELTQGKKLTEAAQFRHHALVESLDVPPEKLYCAVLAETALHTALRDYTARRAVTSS